VSENDGAFDGWLRKEVLVEDEMDPWE